MTGLNLFWFNKSFHPGEPDECWPWGGTIDMHGYGKYGRRGGAHRVAYEHLVGPVPEGLQLDHLCRNRSCVNPAHLEPVTVGENIRRGHKARGTTRTDRRSQQKNAANLAYYYRKKQREEAA